jgi:hypothetical protein
MTGLFKNMFVWFSIVVIVAATGGIGIFQTSCNCSGQVISENQHCSTEDDQHCCTRAAGEDLTPVLGAMPGKVPTPAPCPADENCCNTVYLFFKTDLVNLTTPIAQFLKFHKAYQLTIQDELSSHADGTAPMQCANDQAPLYGFGKPLLIRLHQLKTGPQIG